MWTSFGGVFVSLFIFSPHGAAAGAPARRPPRPTPPAANGGAGGAPAAPAGCGRRGGDGAAREERRGATRRAGRRGVGGRGEQEIEVLDAVRRQDRDAVAAVNAELA